MSASRRSTLTSWILTHPGNGDASLIVHDFGQDDRPKQLFLFTVEFGFRENFADKGNKALESISYDLKSASRPNITFNMEDVNFYNYRAKVITRTNYGTIKLTFYEDSRNVANDLLWNYIKLVSPLTQVVEDNVMTGGESGVISGGTPSTVGNLKNADGPIKWMKVHHHYLHGDTKHITTYTCVNPKIETVEYDDLDMSNSEASSTTVTFTIEGVNVEHH